MPYTSELVGKKRTADNYKGLSVFFNFGLLVGGFGKKQSKGLQKAVPCSVLNSIIRGHTAGRTAEIFSKNERYRNPLFSYYLKFISEWLSARWTM